MALLDGMEIHAGMTKAPSLAGGGVFYLSLF